MIKPKKHIKDFESYPLGEERKWVLKLDFNENLIGPSKKVIDAIRNLDVEKIKFYPFYNELIKKISEFNSTDVSMILPTNGADDALKTVFDTYIDDCDEVLTVTPTFVMSKQYSKPTGCKFVEVPYKEKWVFPIEDFLANITDKTKLIIVTSPNSPTSELISDENLNRILENSKDKLVLVDQTYASYSGKSYVSLLKEHKNLIVMRSMSKDFALAGLRLGYILADEEIICCLRATASPYAVNSIAALAGVEALSDVEHFSFVKEEIEKSKAYLTEELSKIAKVYPSSSNFLCVDFGSDSLKAEFVYKKLLKNGIKVKFYKNHPELGNAFRLTIPPLEGAKLLVKKLQPKKMLVFDMDGVLVDIRNSYRVAIQKTFKFFVGEEISDKEIQNAKNLGGLNNDWDLTEFLINQKGKKPAKSEIIDKFQEIYFGTNGKDGLINDENWLISKEEIEELSQKYDLALFTGRPRVEAMFALKNNNVDKFFSAIITMDDLSKEQQKPSPTGLLRITEATSPIETYYFGDTPDDMKAAKAALVNGIAVLPPQDKSEELKNLMKHEGCVVILNEIREILTKEFLD